MSPKIDPQSLVAWATILLDHSIGGVQAGQVILIRGEHACWPLMAELQRQVLARGGVPDIYLSPPDLERCRVWSAPIARILSVDQLEAPPAWMIARWQRADKFIEVMGAEDPSLYAGLPGDKSGAIVKAWRVLSEISQSKPWVLTLYPTQGFADMEDMDLQTFADFVVAASTVDPQSLVACQELLKPLFDASQQVTIVTQHPDGRELTLTMGIAQGAGYMCVGEKNWPDGEVFTSPDANTVEGEIYIDLTVHSSGVDIQGIYLRFERGVIVEYSALQGMEQLRAIIETDAGSHRLGEIALGVNSGLSRVLRNGLYVEKVGGTLHIAIGNSYEYSFVGDRTDPEAMALIAGLKKAGIYNVSARHVDVVVDFREGGCGRHVFFDGQEVVSRDGTWVLK